MFKFAMYWDTLGARRLPLKPAIFTIMVSDSDRIPTVGVSTESKDWVVVGKKWQMAEAKKGKQLEVVLRSFVTTKMSILG